MFTNQEKIEIIICALLNEIPVELCIDDKKIEFVMENNFLYLLNDNKMFLTNLSINDISRSIGFVKDDYILRLSRLLKMNKPIQNISNNKNKDIYFD